MNKEIRIERMVAYKDVLRRVGLVLILIACLDISRVVIMSVGGINTLPRALTGIDVLIAGFLLIIGSLEAAWVISWFMALNFGVQITRILIVLALHFDNPQFFYALLKSVSGIQAVLVGLTSLIVSLWGYRMLTSTSIQEAIAEMSKSR